MNSIISVEKLTKNFGSLIAVDQISFEIYENEIFGLIGPNGSGKTTTQRMLATVLKPTSGQIFYQNRKLSLANPNKIRHLLGYVPQGDCLYEDLTVWENLDLFSRPYGLKNNLRRQNIDSIIDRLDLKTKRNTLVKNLSGGLAKRVSIAAALVHKPKILFLDEITTGLDPNSRYHLWELIEELKKETTILMTTHYMDEVEHLCDRVMILSEGKIASLGKTAEILKSYQSKNLNEVMGQVIKSEKE